jgi:N-acetylmuramic acid 6-phosphate etherase
LAASATVVIEAVVGPEALRESSRLGAGTAQKLTLDALTTAAATRLGRVHGQFMIDVVAANAKLRRRVAGIVAEIAGCDQDAAEAALDACSGNARAAVLSIVGGLSPGRAQERAAATESLRQALAELAAEPRTLPSPH